MEAEATVTFDGNKAEDLGTDDVVEISRSKYTTKIITLNQMSIYETLRTKLAHIKNIKKGNGVGI